eukprot:6496676-Prymnesium_polylepis.1
MPTTDMPEVRLVADFLHLAYCRAFEAAAACSTFDAAAAYTKAKVLRTNLPDARRWRMAPVPSKPQRKISSFSILTGCAWLPALASASFSSKQLTAIRSMRSRSVCVNGLRGRGTRTWH